MCVVLYHIPQLSESVDIAYFDAFPIFHKGPQAVSVFFCLSGFLIVGLLYEEKERFGTINITKFYLRRALRLYPVYYLVLSFGLVYYHFLLPLFGIAYQTDYSISEGLLWNTFFLPNVFKALHDPGAILEILWSIGIEEQFYLLIAQLFSISAHRMLHRYLALFTVGYFLIFHLEHFAFLKNYHQLYFFMSAGGVVSILSRKGFKLHFKHFGCRILVYVCFGFYFLTDVFYSDNEIVRHMIDVMLFNALIVNLASEDRFEICNRWVNALGKISYGIYMYHMIVVNLVLFLVLKYREAIDLSAWQEILIVNLASIILTIVIAHLSFTYYESYFLGLKQKFRRN